LRRRFPPPLNFVFRFAKCPAKKKDVALVPPAHTRATIRNSLFALPFSNILVILYCC
jgi:hypothetical protein